MEKNELIDVIAEGKVKLQCDGKKLYINGKEILTEKRVQLR